MADKYYFLKVGCADCTVMHLGSKTVMVDCHQGDSSSGEEDILERVRNKRIDLLILTHAHYDHFDGIQALIDNQITVNEIWESNYERRYGDASVAYDEWSKYKNLVEQLNAPVYHPTRSTESYDTVGGARFQFYAPRRNINQKDDRCIHDASLVFTVRKGTMTATFAGDASDCSLKEITDYFSLKKKHVLHASHHGSLAGAQLDFIKVTSPDYTIVSTKSGVHSNVPSPTALQRYRSHTKKHVRRTDVDGTRVFTVK